VIVAVVVAGSDRDRDSGTAQTQAPKQPEATVVADKASQDLFEEQVQEYLRLFPYQETYRYLMLYMRGNPGKLNTWVMASRDLIKAGEDKVVRTNNDTLYKMAWVYLGEGPVLLQSTAPSNKRFSSFELQDKRNANYGNIMYPEGS
jgi:hypothetical protein